MNINPPRSRPRRVPPIILSDPGRNPPTGIIDTREQMPLELPGLKTVIRGLVSGDYSLVGGEHIFAVERKSISDLTGCVTKERERFERELLRLRGYRFKRLLIVGTVEQIEEGMYVSAVPPAAVFASLATWEMRYDVPVYFADGPEIAGAVVANWIRSFARELILDAANAVAQTPGAKSPKTSGDRQEAA